MGEDDVLLITIVDINYILESLIDFENVSLLLYHGPILPVNVTVFCMVYVVNVSQL